MRGSEFDESRFFAAIGASGARSLLIGRGATDLAAGVTINLPALDDLIATKRFAARPKDLEDIRLLEALREGTGGAP